MVLTRFLPGTTFSRVKLPTRKPLMRHTADQHDAEATLPESERTFRALFEMPGMGCAIVDVRSGRFVQVNRHFEEMVGYPAEDLYLLQADSLLHPDEVEKGPLDQRYVRKDGGTLWVRVISSLIHDPRGEPLREIRVIHDVTDRKAEQELIERALLDGPQREGRRIGQELHDDLCQHLLGAAFAAKALSHDLPEGTPAAIEAGEVARLVNSAVQQARDIARGLNPVELDGSGLMTALERLAQRMRHAPCRLDCPQPVALPNAKAALHAFQIAQEAVTNAVAHSGASEIVIRLSEDARGVQLQIVDDGCGFDQGSALARGLGLESMKYRARAMGGDLRIDTRKPGGTSVTLVLPKRFEHVSR